MVYHTLKRRAWDDGTTPQISQQTTTTLFCKRIAASLTLPDLTKLGI